MYVWPGQGQNLHNDLSTRNVENGVRGKGVVRVYKKNGGQMSDFYNLYVFHEDRLPGVPSVLSVHSVRSVRSVHLDI